MCLHTIDVSKYHFGQCSIATGSQNGITTARRTYSDHELAAVDNALM